MTEADAIYFQNRLEEELRRASVAAIPEVALTHRCMAKGYRSLLEKAGKASTPELLTA